MKRRTKEPDPGAIGSEIMTLRDVARYLSCHYTTVYRLVQRGGLPVFHLGSDYRIRRADLEEWIQQQSVVPGGKAALTDSEPKVAKARPKSKA